MPYTPLVRTLLNVIIRRGLSMLGAVGAGVSDDWVTTTVGLLLAAGNEAYQAWQKYKAEKAKQVQDGTSQP